jgi:hypothetical protein
MVLIRCSAWLEEKDVSKLSVAMIQSYLETSNNKPTDLVKAYRVALRRENGRRSVWNCSKN